MNDYDGTLAKPELDDVLEHHGVKGMKWGIRRYQNEDGTYTSAGRRRYALDRDVNDKSRRNIAKIRTGEAKRRYDVAKEKNPTNTYRLAELKGRIRTAKRAEKLAKRMDKGAKLAAKGQTIRRNNTKSLVAALAAWKLAPAIGMATNIGLRTFNEMQKSKIASGGTGRVYGEDFIRNASNFAEYSVYGLAAAYGAKQRANNANLRAYQNSKSYGDTAIKRIGSDEYASRVKRSKKK